MSVAGVQADVRVLDRFLKDLVGPDTNDTAVDVEQSFLAFKDAAGEFILVV
jgi:hypothetical protein